MKTLSSSELAFAQYVGALSYTPTFAIEKLFPQLTKDDVKILADKYLKRREVKMTINEYQKKVHREAVVKAADIVSFDKAAAMQKLMIVMDKAQYSLNIDPIERTVVREICEFLKTKAYSKEFINNIRKRLTYDFDAKAADSLMKATDQANKLYGNYEYKITIDDKRDKLATTLDNMSEEQLLMLANGMNEILPS